MHYPDDNSATLDFPEFTHFDPETAPLTMRADQGQVSHNGEDAYFTGNVLVRRHAYADQKEMTLQTSYLHVIPDKDLAKTDREVTLTSGNSMVKSVGLEFNNATRSLKLLSQVRRHVRDASQGVAAADALGAAALARALTGHPGMKANTRQSMDASHAADSAPACALLAAVVLSMPAAHAERADRAKPVNVEADRLSLDDLKKESVFEGNVQLTQGSLLLRADRVVVRQDEQGFNYAFATGAPAYFRQKREGFDEYIEGFAQRLEYNGKQDKVEMFTEARVKKGIDEVRGDYISYNAVTEFYEVVGGGTLRGHPGQSAGAGARRDPAQERHAKAPSAAGQTRLPRRPPPAPRCSRRPGLRNPPQQ